jgi:hypothetical protein
MPLLSCASTKLIVHVDSMSFHPFPSTTLILARRIKLIWNKRTKLFWLLNIGERDLIKLRDMDELMPLHPCPLSELK